jgi:signal transduction histidine kinase
MEATLLSSAQLGTSGAAADDTVLAGIRICKSFLSAFREVATLARDAEGWQAESLELALRSAAQLYAQQDKLSIKLELDVPGSVAGYDNNYILAVLLPLLENAIEASPADGLVGISLRTDFAAGFQVFDVVNATRLQPVLPTEVYDQQWTSKAGHDGLGLSTVKNLLAGMSSARVTHSVASDGRVRFSVWLPRRLP